MIQHSQNGEGVEVLRDSANSHCFDDRIMVAGECIAFASEPWSSKIAASLAREPATADVRRERYAKLVENFHFWQGSNDLADERTKEWLAAAIRAAPSSGHAMADVGRGWRCYHCGDVFTDDRCARLHFGRDEDSTPACQIKAGAEQGLLGALREAEYAAADAQQAVANESTDAAKAYYAQASRHAQALRNAEELGYERGLADGRAAPLSGLKEPVREYENTVADVIKGSAPSSEPAMAEGERVDLAEVDAVIREMIDVAVNDGEDGTEETDFDRGDVDRWQARLQRATGHINGFPSRPAQSLTDATTPPTTNDAIPAGMVEDQDWMQMARDAAASVRPGSPWASRVQRGHYDDSDEVRSAMAAIDAACAITTPKASAETGGAGELPAVLPGHWTTPAGRDMALATLDDPHMAQSRERISDFALANEVFLSPGVANLTDAKERIRWLSATLAALSAAPSAPATEAGEEA